MLRGEHLRTLLDKSIDKGWNLVYFGTGEEIGSMWESPLMTLNEEFSITFHVGRRWFRKVFIANVAHDGSGPITMWLAYGPSRLKYKSMIKYRKREHKHGPDELYDKLERALKDKG